MPETLTPPSPPSSAAPAAPSPSPNATPSPAPSPSPDAGDTQDPFAMELETKFAKANADLSPNEPAKPAPKAPEAPATPPKPAPQPPKVEAGPKALREELDRTKAELKANAEAKASLEAKIKEYDSKGKDTESLLARLKARDEEFEKLQGEIRALKQEASPEFKEKYETPFNRAADYATEVVKSILKTDGTPADFEKDFVPIYRLAGTNYGRAAAEARELFGDDAAPAIMDQVRELRRLEVQKNRAFEDEKKGWAEKQKAEEGRKVQEREHRSMLKKKVREDLRNSVETYRDPVDDKELAEARNKGYAIFDREESDPRTQLVKDEHIRHRVAAFGPNQLQIKRLQARNAELEERLAGSKGGQPNPDPRKPGGTETTAPQESWEEGARKAVKA